MPGAQTKIRVIVVDDSAFMRKVVSEILEVDKRIEVVGTARNGRIGVELFAQTRPDVVTMDVEMPEMDGPKATALIRVQEKQTGEHIPIIAMTAHAMKGDRERCLQAGIDDYVSKPVQAQHLFDALESLLRDR